MRRPAEQERHETDRLDLLHEITARALIGEWVDVERYKALYIEIHGPLPGTITTLEHSINEAPLEPRLPWEKF